MPTALLAGFSKGEGVKGLSSDSAMAQRRELIVHYAQLGHTIDEITLYLNNAHGIPIRQADCLEYKMPNLYN